MTDVLLVEDNPADARLCVEILAESREDDFDITQTGSLKEAFARLDEAAYDVVLLDLGLPESTGLDTLRRFKEHNAEVPVVVLTGLADETTGHNAVGMGAQDYLVKGFAEIEHVLPRAIRYGMERAELSRALARHQRLELIAQISGGVAHDFNNILASIMGFTDLAIQNLDEGGKERIINYLNRIRNSAIRGRDLVRQLLLFGRPEERPSAENLDLASACADIVSNIRPLIPSSISIDWIDGASARVDVDKIHLHQIIMNLVINARDALGGAGSIKIGVEEAGPRETACSACREPASGRFASICVSDSGPGIDPDILPRVFEPYVTNKGPDKGSGMGLSVVSHIVHGYGGHIQLESSPGRGATFRVLLPPAVAEREEPRKAELPAYAPHVDTAGRSILVVDDEEDLRSILVEYLDSQAFAVRAVDNGRDALAFFRQSLESGNPVDLVITDQTMPGLTGLELAAEIKKIAPRVPVVLCTGYSAEVGSGARPANVDHLFYKPFDVDQLDLVIGELLNE